MPTRGELGFRNYTIEFRKEQLELFPQLQAILAEERRVSRVTRGDVVRAAVEEFIESRLGANAL